MMLYEVNDTKPRQLPIQMIENIYDDIVKGQKPCFGSFLRPVKGQYVNSYQDEGEDWAHIEIDESSFNEPLSTIIYAAPLSACEDEYAQMTVEKAIIYEYRGLLDNNVDVVRIHSAIEEGATIYFVVINCLKIDLSWYKHFSEIELRLNSYFNLDAIGFMHISESMEESGIIPTPSRQIL